MISDSSKPANEKNEQLSVYVCFANDLHDYCLLDALNADGEVVDFFKGKKIVSNKFGFYLDAKK